MEYAFQLLQQDLVRWQLSRHALPEHHAVLQLTLDNAKVDVPSALLDGAVETPSALARTFDKAKGAAKQVANDLLRRNAALNAQWQAENGLATFTDQKTGKALSPDDLGKDIANAMQGLRGPKDKQLSEALGKIGGEQAKRRQAMETDPRYVDRYHGPDDVARDKDGKLVELEYKGNKTDSTSVAKDNQNNRQGSKGKNKRRADKMMAKSLVYSMNSQSRISTPSNQHSRIC